MTEEIAGTPGWVDERLDHLLAGVPASSEVGAARAAYLDCLASRKSPAAPSDQLGAEFVGCRSTFLAALRTHAGTAELGTLGQQLELLEAEIDGDS